MNIVSVGTHNYWYIESRISNDPRLCIIMHIVRAPTSPKEIIVPNRTNYSIDIRGARGTPARYDPWPGRSLIFPLNISSFVKPGL